MLGAHEFFVGPLASASGMTLVLRRHEREASTTTISPHFGALHFRNIEKRSVTHSGSQSS